MDRTVKCVFQTVDPNTESKLGFNRLRLILVNPVQEPAPNNDHYFSAQPVTAAKKKVIEVELNGSTYELFTAPGVFSPGHLDTGTKVLLKAMTAPPTGHLLDIGCGWGPIALTMALQNPDAQVWAVDVNERSLDLTTQNAQTLGLTNIKAVTPDQVPKDIEFAEVWSNPPIRIGKDQLHELLRLWLPRLSPGSSAFMVVQKNLGADTLARWLDEEFSSGPESLMSAQTVRVSTSKSFRILETIRQDV